LSTFRKKSREISSFIIIWHEYRVLHGKTNTRFWL